MRPDQKIVVIKKMTEQYNKASRRGHPVKTKRTINDELSEKKIKLLEMLKSDTSISKSNHMIQVVAHNDKDGIERLYFYVSNMNYGEYHPQQQDCYGRINGQGKVELYVSRDLPENMGKISKNDQEAYCQYTSEERKRIEEFKQIIDEELEKLKIEEKQWEQKSSTQKMFSNMKGKKDISKKKIIDLIINLPERLQETKTSKLNSFDESLKIDISGEHNGTKPTDNSNSEKGIDDIEI